MGFFNSLAGHFYAFVLSVALFTQMLLGAISGHVTVVTPPPLTHFVSTSSSTSSLLSFILTKTASTTPSKPIPKTTTVLTQTKSTAKTVVTSSTPVPAAPVAVIPTEQLNAQTRSALVNILCTTKAGGSFEPISGSGVMVDTRGVILTNAHVAQFFLLHDYGSPGNVQCVIRTGSPAEPAYNAELLYLPPSWVNANASQITSQKAMGTGENDYAFLLITNPAAPTLPYPSSFPALAMTSASPDVNDPVLLAAYPAGFLGGTTIQMDLYVSSALSTVQELFTFDDPSNIDLISLGGTVVAQSGSSGGAVVSATSGKLIGIIATESQGTTTASRDLNAITISHINRSLTSLGQGGITGLLSGDLNQEAQDFNTNTAPGEIKTLEAVLNKQ
jgi:hypothetical protein